MRQTEPIKDFHNRIIGFVETDTHTGNKVGKDFYRRIVGYYDANQNVTQDFYHRIVGRGDTLVSLIMQAAENNKK